MNARLSQSVFAADAWFGGRVVNATGEATRAAVVAFQSAWRDSSKHVDQARSWEMMADVNDRTLKDIGAPDWLIARSAERRHAHHLHLLELYRS